MVHTGFSSHPNLNPERVSQYKIYENCLNFDGIQFPVQPTDIARFNSKTLTFLSMFCHMTQKAKVLSLFI